MRKVTIQYNCKVNGKLVDPVVLNESDENFFPGKFWKEKKEVTLMGGAVVEASHTMIETHLSDEEILKEVYEGLKTLLDDRYPYSDITTNRGVYLSL